MTSSEWIGGLSEEGQKLFEIGWYLQELGNAFSMTGNAEVGMNLGRLGKEVLEANDNIRGHVGTMNSEMIKDTERHTGQLLVAALYGCLVSGKGKEADEGAQGKVGS